jgi:hypothetical protein
MTVTASLLGFGVVCLVLLVAEYFSAPVAELRHRYLYTPRGSTKSIPRVIGLGVADGVQLSQIPGHFILALLLHEDDLFFCHGGFNWREIRARVKARIVDGEGLAGGSSITQQLAKNLRNDFTQLSYLLRLFRKRREVLWAMRLEREFSKTEILTLYLNTVRFGPLGVYGLEAAAWQYLGKAPRDLRLEESFFLLGLLPQPLKIVEALRAGDLSLFRFRHSLEKFQDLFRMQVSLFGWGGLEKIESLTSQDAIQVMSAHNAYIPKAFSPELEIALNVRSLMMVDSLRAVAKTFGDRSQQASGSQTEVFKAA